MVRSSKASAASLVRWLYVANDFKQKGTAKWVPMIFVGISDKKQYIVLHGKTMRVTRSIKRIFPDASQHLAAYQQVLVCSWVCEGVLGTKLRPSTAKHLRADTGQDLDLAALDPEDMFGFDLPDDTPISMLAPSARVRGEHPNQLRERPENTATGVVPMADTSMTETMTASHSTVDEPAAKRQKMTISAIGHFQYSHVDDTDATMGVDFDFEVFSEWPMDDEAEDTHDIEYQKGGDDEEQLWFHLTAEEPSLDESTLVSLDAIADRVEVSRLQDMDVLLNEQDLADNVELGGDLTARFVRTWRKKSNDGEEWWYRRSRLVAREFNKLCVRDDLYSPASNHIVERLVPALCMSHAFSNKHVLGALDISDAYLQVPQEVPRRISILDGGIHSGLVINKCLPGQRDGSRKWFDHFSAFLISKLDLSPCLEQPALFKIPEADGGGALLMHVDDVLFALDEKYLLQKFMPAIRDLQGIYGLCTKDWRFVFIFEKVACA